MNDLISRCELFNRLAGVSIADGVSEYGAQVYAVIQTMPSAIPTGEWVEDYDPDMNVFFRQGWRCTACGGRQTYGRPRYCPMCGARMNQGDDDEQSVV